MKNEAREMILKLPPLDEQKEFVISMRASEVNKAIRYEEKNSDNPILKGISNGYIAPTPQEVTALIDEIKEKTPLTNIDIQRSLGLSVNPKNRTIRKWCKGDEVIPYGAWRLLLAFTGRVVIQPLYNQE
ncbi:hypothetical protein JK628_02915 [Shewanella sp. KX20019]|uniref:hypothetical protein n=1 Tax=Shewanella sp. KX20019 TaxID=2803864 RepID=UPI001925C473|nr:hypothetical protein [Shewanella sp. KX20019]QQX80841.1 hypothetical protein JK628_02915 [Shewanella sp. KX20019]